MENKLEEKILELFLFNTNLKFNEIKKSLNIRSNKLAYHIKQLIKKDILIKNQEEYSLSETAENLIPYLSNKKAVLPVILVHIGNNKECFLYKRKKRPFKDQISLPGGRPVLGESISKATERIMKEKFNINCILKKINSLSIEHLKKSKKIIQTDLIIFITAKTKDKIHLTNIEKNKKHIITSDYQILKRDLNKRIEIKNINTLKI
jgi:ADP-ribose pyrophosphatase YjhB (NUDIX family)